MSGHAAVSAISQPFRRPVYIQVGYEPRPEGAVRPEHSVRSLLFDPASRYSRLRSGFRSQETFLGYLRWLKRDRGPAEQVRSEESAAQVSNFDRYPREARRLFAMEPRDAEDRPLRAPCVAVVVGSVAPLPAAPAVQWRRKSSSEDLFELRIEGLSAYRGGACRVFFIDDKVLRHAQRLVPEIDWSDLPSALQALFDETRIRKHRDVIRLLSALPDLDGQVDDSGTVKIEIDGPSGCPDPLEHASIVLALDFPHDDSSASTPDSTEAPRCCMDGDTTNGASVPRDCLSMEWTRQFELEMPRLKAFGLPISNPVLRDVYALFSLLAFEAATHARQQLAELLGSVSERFRASAGEVFRLADDGRLETLITNNVSKSRLEANVDDAKGIVAFVARQQRGYCAPDVTNGRDPLYREDIRETRSEIAVPIIDPTEPDREQRLLGVINLESREVNAFSSAQIGALQAAVGAFVPHLLVLAAATRSDEMWLPWHPEIHGWDLTRVFQKLCHTITASLGADSTKCSIWYVDRLKQSLFVYATSGYDIEYMRHRTLSLDSCTGRIADAPRGHVYSADPLREFVEQEKAARMGLKEALLCPICPPGSGSARDGISVLNIYFTERTKDRAFVREAMITLADVIGAMAVSFDGQRQRLAAAQLHHLLKEMPRSSASDFEVIRDCLKDVFSADGVSIFARVPNDSHLRCTATTGLCKGHNRDSTADPRDVEYDLENRRQKGFTITLARHPGVAVRMNNVLDRNEKDLPEFLPRGPLLKFVENFPPREDKNRRLLAYGITSTSGAGDEPQTGEYGVGVIRVLRRSGSKPFTRCDERLIAYLADFCRPAFWEWQRNYQHLKLESLDRKSREALKAFARILRPVPVGRSTRTLIGELVQDLFRCYGDWNVSRSSVFVRHGAPDSDCFRLHAFYSEPDATPPLKLVTGGMPSTDAYLEHRRVLKTQTDEGQGKLFGIAVNTTLEGGNITSGIRVPIKAWSNQSLIDSVLALDFEGAIDWDDFLIDPLLYGVCRLIAVWNGSNVSDDDQNAMLGLALGRESLLDGVERCRRHLQDRLGLSAGIHWSDRLPADWKPFPADEDNELALYGVMRHVSLRRYAIPLLIGPVPSAFFTVEIAPSPDAPAVVQLRSTLDAVSRLWSQMTSGRTDTSGRSEFWTVSCKHDEFARGSLCALSYVFQWNDAFVAGIHRDSEN